ncbi:MAG: methionyl-tRNA formyltransferase [Candidatus Dojkabacteria bacterium]|nr:MAG: methionyl-tRNA formyltransferase [Candidatus Dojkabacteria bacterium]
MAIKTLFLGSNWEALTTLKTLHQDSRFEIVGVITQPDKPTGRKQEILPTEVKQYCLDNNIPVFHTEKDEAKYQEALDTFKPELLVCKSFGEIIPEFFLEAPKYKAINIHFSLLPKYRGAIPIQKAILEGDSKTGISIVRMVKELDAGEVLETFEEDILPTDTNQTLRERLVEKSSKVIGDILMKWVAGEIKPIPQDESKATFCWQKEISKDAAQINWSQHEPDYIEKMVRAMQPWPVAWSFFTEGRRMKIFKVEVIDNSDGQLQIEAGDFYTKEERLFVGTKNPLKLIQILELQLEGKNRMSAAEFVRGQDL